MATLNEVVTDLEAAQATLDAMEVTVETAFKALADLIAELKAGNSTDPAIIARIQAVADDLRAKALEFQSDIPTV